MTVGKRVRGALYLHRKALASLPSAEQTRIEAASQQCEFEWNVVRLSSGSLALLKYRNFEDDPFPALELSLSFRDGEETTNRIDYSRRDNPPVLHRKELLVGADHPRQTEWAALTERLIEHGAFDKAHLIGNRKAWSARLASLGLTAASIVDD